MTPVTDLDVLLTSSKQSEAPGTRFVKRSPRSWYLRRVLSNNIFTELYEDGWMNCSKVGPFTEHEVNNSDAKMANLVSDHTKGLVPIHNTQ